MSQNHEIIVIYLPRNERIETIYIPDDFFCYLCETQPLQHKFINNFPVFYPDENDLKDLDKFQNRKPINKGIAFTGINILNSSSFEELFLNSIKWKQIIEDLDDYILNESDYELMKDDLKSNIDKLSTILRDISFNKTEYLLLWEGI